MDNSPHKIFKPEDMSNFVGSHRQLLAAAAHERTFSSQMQFLEFYRNWESMQEEVPHFEADSVAEDP